MELWAAEHVHSCLEVMSTGGSIYNELAEAERLLCGSRLLVRKTETVTIEGSGSSGRSGLSRA